ncbi:glycoside hydrolase family 3 C-terminal domain-containing protein [Coraliomargarita parva]|uniref:glycoside hydrolase family 3 C-terminal domain-containing protein n=1 Tax=Coraliomargarita parva TaxID=3014050 RepID=UPI0022B5E37F|nr:glycoside hydrolase family 3 C-terminal domain-containing protein [Coraliomargarita parva]
MNNSPCPEKRFARSLSLLAFACACIGQTVQADAMPDAGPADQAWRDASKAPEERAELLLAAMSREEKVALVSSTNPEDTDALRYLGIPALTRVDASAGLRGDYNVTAFPVPLALAATFNKELGHEMGAAIGKEARQKAWNVILGPTMDVARSPLNGRITESFGEDPVLNGWMGAKVAEGMESQHTIAQIKHYTVYNQEWDRLVLDIEVSDRALQEVYNLPFHIAINEGGADSVMGSYPRINGTFACENFDLLENFLKANPNFKGYVGTDDDAAKDKIAQVNAGIDSMALIHRPIPMEAFFDGTVSDERIDEATRRMLFATFENGLFDHPLPEQKAEVVTTPEHLTLAKQIAEEGTVLLKNADDFLPLDKNVSVAVIGPTAKDMVTGVQGSTYVRPGDYLTPVDAIRRAVEGSGEVVVAQGTLGDVTLPAVPAEAFKTRLGEPGLKVEYFDNAEWQGLPKHKDVVSHLDFHGKPIESLPENWSARYTGTITSPSTGLVRFSARTAGHIEVIIDGKTVIDGRRSESAFFQGDGGHYTYPIQGTVMMEAGRPVDIEVRYTRLGARWNHEVRLGWQPESLIPAAVEAAKQADVAVIFVNQVSGEEMDRDNLNLVGDQPQLIEAVSAANPNTIVVLNTPGAVLMPWLDDVKAVFQIWYPGAEGGSSFADILFGDSEPGGRLPLTFPASEAQGPQLYQGGGHIAYPEGVFVGYRYFDLKGQEPLFPFGFGLSYTDFDYSLLRLTTIDQGPARVKVNVKNTGDRAGSDVVQVYLGELPTTMVDTPIRKLVAFERVYLKSGEEKTVTLEIPEESFNYWSEADKKWIRPTGEMPVYIGRSSRDIQLDGTMVVN